MIYPAAHARFALVTVATIALAVATGCHDHLPAETSTLLARYETEDARVEVHVSPATPSIIDAVELRLVVVRDAGVVVRWPDADAIAGDWAASRTQSETNAIGPRFAESRTYTLEPFLPGVYRTDTVTLEVDGDPIVIEPIEVDVAGAAGDASAMQTVAELREPPPASRDPLNVLVVAGSIAALAALGAVAPRLLGRRALQAGSESSTERLARAIESGRTSDAAALREVDHALRARLARVTGKSSRLSATELAATPRTRASLELATAIENARFGSTDASDLPTLGDRALEELRKLDEGPAP